MCEFDPDVAFAVGGGGCDVDEDWAFVGLEIVLACLNVVL